MNPLPTQPKVVDNCYKFHLVKSGDSGASIASKNSITLSDLTK